MRKQQYIISFDAGGTRLKTAVMSIEGIILDTFHCPSNAIGGAAVLLDTMCTIIKKVSEEREGNLAGIGLSLSGVIHPDKGVVFLPGKFKMLEGFPIVEKLKFRFDVPVTADNDGRLALYAERFLGQAKNTGWVVGLTIGTGVGSGVIIDGKMLTNRFLQFGVQVGHLIQDASGDRFCLTGNYGTGETLCSATALTLQVRSAIQRGIPCILSDDYFKAPTSVTFETITNACRAGDPLCLRELKTWSNHLALLIVNAVHAYSPELIVLSGGATLAADLFLDDVQAKVNRQVFRYPVGEPVPIVVSEMQEYASALGAALFVIHTLPR